MSKPIDPITAFKEKLDKEHEWPINYMFKFVVPSAKTEQLKTILAGESLKSRPSKNGKYISYTMKKRMNSSDEVVDVYTRVKIIEGLIAL